MGPSELASELRKIAGAIDASKKPDRRLVAAALRRVIAEVNPGRVDRQVDRSDRVQGNLELEAAKIRKAIEELQSALAAIEEAIAAT